MNMKSKTQSKIQNFGFWFVVLVFGFWFFDFSYAQEGRRLSQEEKVQKAREYYAAGQQLMQKGDYRRADAQFKKAQGLLLKDSSQALEDAALLENTKSAPANVLSPGKMALDAAGKGAPEEAIALYQKAINASPRDANLHYNLALEELKSKRFQDAARTFKRALQLAPKDKDAYYNLAVLYESYLNDKKQALNYYALYLKYALPADNTTEAKEWMRQLRKELKK